MGVNSVLGRVIPPFVHLKVVSAEEEEWLPSHVYKTEGVELLIRTLRGRKMRTKQALMDEAGAALQFFEGFGENWHALLDCLRSLAEWMPAQGYLLVVSNAQELLVQEEDRQLAWFVQTLQEVGVWWAKPIRDGDVFDREAIPFHVILLVTDGEGARKVMARLGASSEFIEFVG